MLQIKSIITRMLVFTAAAAAVVRVCAWFMMCLYRRMAEVHETLYRFSILSDRSKSGWSESDDPMFRKLHFEPRGRVH